MQTTDSLESGGWREPLPDAMEQPAATAVGVPASLLFHYKLGLASVARIVLCFLAIGAALAYAAATGHPLSLLIWSLLGICFLATALAVWTALRSDQEQALELSEHKAVMPKASLSRELMAVPYEAIHQVRLEAAGEQQRLIINTAQGTARLMSGAFDSKQAFADFQRVLTERVLATRAAYKVKAGPGRTAPPGLRHPDAVAFLRSIENECSQPPSEQAQRGAREVCQCLIGRMKSEQGVHLESLLCGLGALAGYACQASVRRQAQDRGLPEQMAFVVAGAGNGQHYFFGAPLNRLLAENKYSVWSLATGAAQSAGCKVVPDIALVFRHTAECLGTSQFGELRMPENHRPADTPAHYLKALWPVVQPIAERTCPQPAEWPAVYGSAIQQVIAKASKVLDPGIALAIVAQSAVAMSKLDLAEA